MAVVNQADYGLVAKTEMLGSGGAIVRAYHHYSQPLIVIELTQGDHCIELGPFDRRALPSLLNTLRDVEDMKTPMFLRDE